MQDTLESSLTLALRGAIASIAAEAVEEVLPGAFKAHVAQYVQGLGVDALSVKLLATLDDLAAKRAELAGLVKAGREADEDLALASLPLEAEAFSNGKNEQERKTKLAGLQAKDAGYVQARKRRNTLQADRDLVDADLRALEDRFAALRTIAKLEAAKLAFLAGAAE